MSRHVRVSALRAAPPARPHSLVEELPGRALGFVLALGELLADACSAAHVAARAAAQVATLGRAAAVGLLDDDGETLVVLGSAGYACDAMAPGTRIPRDSGLPFVEAAATGRTVVRGDGSGAARWVAVPLPDLRGALLLSDPAPGWGEGDLRGLHAAARLVAGALSRAQVTDRAARALTGVTEPLQVRPLPADAVPGLSLAARLVPQDRELGLGGDVLAAVPDERGGSWLVVADVRGHGAAAAVLAGQLRSALGALAPVADGPAALLAGLDRAVAASLPDPDDPDAAFATALAVHVRCDVDVVVLRTASAGHPLPLLRDRTGVRAVGVPGGLLGTGLPAAVSGRPEHEERLDVDAWLLVLHSDGLVDAPVPGAGEPRVQAALRRLDLPAVPETAAGALLAAGLPRGVRAPDDVALLVAAPAGATGPG